MKRHQGKIKDFVEPQAFEAVQNFARDTARALAAYRFTDATSDLLARWLDALADLPRSAGASSATAMQISHSWALAGLRGVGKSHTLAAFSALVASPHLRPSVSDNHVATSARRLSTRRYTVVRVERGTRLTLAEEVAHGLASALGSDIGTNTYLAASPPLGFAEMLSVAASQSYDTTFVFVVDTAFGRERRVERDDGPALSELAVGAKNVNAFVALALDDDIADAEGANVALARTFRIDYLDPEHLLRVADQYVLRKSPAARVALHDIYLALRADVPGFNWSEPRFAALYPLHPIIADVAASVRLYAPTFALLPFAAEASGRAGGRPSQSLVSLDEVFDRAEYDLRRAEELKDAFAAYDELTTRAVAQLPVMARLEARLILKALFILSLDGRGAVAGEVCAAMLFYDESASAASERRVEDALRTFARVSAEPSVNSNVGGIVAADEGSRARYRFAINAFSSFDSRVAAAIADITLDATTLIGILHHAARVRFEDFPFGAPTLTAPLLLQSAPSIPAPLAANDDARDGSSPFIANLYLMWRGSQRRGVVIDSSASPSSQARLEPSLQHDDATAKDETNGASANLEWRLTLLPPSLGFVANGASPVARFGAETTINPLVTDFVASNQADTAQPLHLVWQPASPAVEDVEAMRRLVALRTETSLATNFSDQTRAATLTATAHVERIWTRLYIDDGTLIIDGVPHRWSDEARSVGTLTHALSIMLAECFAARFPQHPAFTEPLGEGSVARLITDLFVGNNTNEPEVQSLAEAFAVPLGLAVVRHNAYMLATSDEALRQAWVREVIRLTDAAEGEAVPLGAVQRVLGGAPYGLAREAQYLVLAALVANRRLELVTTTNDRISRRTLGSYMNWEMVAGVARAATILQSTEELTAWARLLMLARLDFDEENRDARRAALEQALDFFKICGENAKANNGEYTKDAAAPPIASISDPTTREAVRRDLAAWLESWQADDILGLFERLPDDSLTTRTWNLAGTVRRTFAAAAEATEAALASDIPLEEGLQRVADSFANSIDTFQFSLTQLQQLTLFTRNFEERERVRCYLEGVEPTGIMEIDTACDELRRLAADPHELFDAERQNSFSERWQDFHERYTAHYTEEHKRPLEAESDRRFVAQIARGKSWREFQSLADLPALDDRRWHKLQRLAKRAGDGGCGVDVREALRERPVCLCSFRLSRVESIAELKHEVAEAVETGVATYRRTLKTLGTYLAHALHAFAIDTTTNELRRVRAVMLADAFISGEVPHDLTAFDVAIMRQAMEGLATPPTVRVELPIASRELLTPEELHARFREWLDELPRALAVIEITDEVNTT